MVIIFMCLINTVMGTAYHHHHHQHHKDYITISTMIEAIPPTLVARDVTSSDDYLPTLSTTSTTSSYSTTIITNIPQLNNPYINVSNLPTNLIFIVVGIILGSMFILMTLYRIITYIKYSRQAHREKETYYSNLDEIINNPYSSYSRNSSLLDLKLTNSSPPTSSSSTQGRSYRDNILGNTNNTGNIKNNNGNRGSMFISPTMDLKSFDLPLYQTQHNTSLASLLMKCINNNNNDNSIIFDEKNGRIINFERNDSSITGSTLNSSILDTKYSSLPQKNPIRAPSMVLEDILNEEIKRSLSEKDISKQKEEEHDDNEKEEKK